MSFLNPTYLWALLGLAVPVAIHLWSKREGKTIKIGSIRLLRKSDPKQTSNLRLNEILLLLLRMLIITLLVFILAEPQLKKDDAGAEITYLIEPSLLAYEEVTSIIDSLSLNSENQLRLLIPGFPEYDREQLPPADTETPNYWQLVPEMEILATDSLVVFTNAFASGLKGKRPRIRRNSSWMVLDPGGPVQQIIAAQRKEGQVEIISVVSDHQKLYFEKELVSVESEQIKIFSEEDSVEIRVTSGAVQLPLNKVDSLRVLIVQNDSLQKELRYLQASYKAISNYLQIPVEVEVVQPDSLPQETKDYHTVVRLDSAMEMEITSPVLIFKPDHLANSIIQKATAENEYYLTRRLNSENIVEEHVPEKLLELFKLHRDLKENIQKYDRRVVAQEELQPVFAGGVSGQKVSEATGISEYLWMLLLVLLLAERGLARYRKL